MEIGTLKEMIKTQEELVQNAKNMCDLTRDSDEKRFDSWHIKYLERSKDLLIMRIKLKELEISLI